MYKGTLREKAYQVQTTYGLVDLPAERVVAMVTLGQYKPIQLLVTADGEVFGGHLKGEVVRLELSGGHVTAVPLGSGSTRFSPRSTRSRRTTCRRRRRSPSPAACPRGWKIVPEERG